MTDSFRTLLRGGLGESIRKNQCFGLSNGPFVDGRDGAQQEDRRPRPCLRMVGWRAPGYANQIAFQSTEMKVNLQCVPCLKPTFSPLLPSRRLHRHRIVGMGQAVVAVDVDQAWFVCGGFGCIAMGVGADDDEVARAGLVGGGAVH